MTTRGTVIQDTVDNYEVLRCILGRGTFGIVYLGRDMHTNDSVAIKCVEPPIQVRRHYMRYIQNELETLNSIDHPNIVDLIHYREIGNCTYFILELCECDLQKFANENAVFQELKFDFILGIAEGIYCLHRHRIIHRDIKPDNVLVKDVRETRTVKLTDLGLSKRVPEGGSTSFSATPGVGTRQWMAPEVFADTNHTARYSMPSDVYSFGLLTWSVLVHRAGEFLEPISGPRGMSIGQWQRNTGHMPELTGGEDSPMVHAMKRIVGQMIHLQAPQRYKAQQVCDAIRSIRESSFTSTISMPPPATGLCVAQAGSHVHLPDAEDHAVPTGVGSAERSNVRYRTPSTSNVPANGLLSSQSGSSLRLSNVAVYGSSEVGFLAQREKTKQSQQMEPQEVDSTHSTPLTPPSLSNSPDSLPANRSSPQSGDKIKLKRLNHFTLSIRDKGYFGWGQMLDFLLSTEDNQTVFSYYMYKENHMSEVSNKVIPQGYGYNCRKYITPQHVILQSHCKKLSIFNHELQLTNRFNCPGIIIGVMGDLYAVVASRTTREGATTVTIYLTLLSNTQEIHQELESPRPTAYDEDSHLMACGWLDGHVAIRDRQSIDFYSPTSHHIQRVVLDGSAGGPSCTAKHVLVPISKKKRRILVFTWSGKLVQRLEPPDLSLEDRCVSLSPVHEGKINVWVHTSEGTNKITTYEMQESEEEDEDNEQMMNVGENGQ